MSSVEYIIEDLLDHPECIHGPTFLLQRNTEKGIKRFFACSACRDRRDCPFFLPEEDRNKVDTETFKKQLEEKKFTFTKDINHKERFTMFQQVVLRFFLFFVKSFIFNTYFFILD